MKKDNPNTQTIMNKPPKFITEAAFVYKLLTYKINELEMTVFLLKRCDMDYYSIEKKVKEYYNLRDAFGSIDCQTLIKSKWQLIGIAFEDFSWNMPLFPLEEIEKMNKNLITYINSLS